MPDRGKQILKIGVTGGIGSGKTAVCGIFERLGVPVLRSDDIAKGLGNSNPVLRAKLIALLGGEAYSADGMLNRSWLAAKIFSDKKLRRKVESIIHPLVAKERELLINEMQGKGHLLVILESALLYETGLDKSVDYIIVVDAEESLRFDRVCRRDSTSGENAKARSDAQLGTDIKVKKADYVIYNNGTLEELESKVRFLYNIFIRIIKKDKCV